MEQIREIVELVDMQFVVYLTAFLGVLLVLEGLRQILSRSSAAMLYIISEFAF